MSDMPYFMGIDIGTGTSKGVLLKDTELISNFSVPSGINYESAANQLLFELLKRGNVARQNIRFVVATGAGSSSVSYRDKTISDLICCAKGMFHLLPEVRTVIDVEGQTTQVFRLGKDGQLANFVTSEKCAGGSGRFMDIISNILQVPLEELGSLSLKSTKPVTFATSCAVFAESEAVSRVAEGIPCEDILAGVHQAMATKILTMIEKVGLEKECALCGGGALNIGLIKTVEMALNTTLMVPAEPHLVTALGAALLAQVFSSDKT
jgi:predicted CoA-substrate-specific enzyme activase